MGVKWNKYFGILNLSVLLYLVINSYQKVQEKCLQNSAFTKDEFLNGSKFIKDGIFWSDLSESFVPKGLSTDESMKYVKNIRNYVVKSLRHGNRAMCGTEENAIARLEDDTLVCVRYKENPFYVYAEVLVYYLSRMLHMDSVPEVVLARTNSSSALWRNVDIGKLSWNNNEVVAMIRLIPDVTSHNHAPRIIRDAHSDRQVITGNTIRKSRLMNQTNIADLIQWGTLIVFDNLIGHYDRLNLWERRNEESFAGSLHNSVKSSKGKIWLVDHEKCLFYQFKHRDAIYNFRHLLDIHDKMLKTICVFQYSLVKRLQALSEQSSPFNTLWNYTLSHEPLLNTMLKDSRVEIIAQLFNKRLAQILQWITLCKEIQ